jgi:hypothetical protein
MFFNPSVKLSNAIGNTRIVLENIDGATNRTVYNYDGGSSSVENDFNSENTYFSSNVEIGDIGTNYTFFVNGVDLTPPAPASSNALITAQPLIVPSNGTIFTSDGASAFECVPQANLNFKNDVLSIVGSTISTNNLGHMAVRPVGANMDVTGNISVINGNSLLLKNGIDTNDIQIYQANNINGSLVIKNNVGSTDEFQGASAYNFDNTININGVPVDLVTINRKLDAITTLLYNLTGIQIS